MNGDTTGDDIEVTEHHVFSAEVTLARVRQDKEWGDEYGGDEFDFLFWLAMLGNQQGSLCLAILSTVFEDEISPSRLVFRQVVHIAAGASAMGESMLRRWPELADGGAKNA